MAIHTLAPTSLASYLVSLGFFLGAPCLRAPSPTDLQFPRLPLAAHRTGLPVRKYKRLNNNACNTLIRMPGTSKKLSTIIVTKGADLGPYFLYFYPSSQARKRDIWGQTLLVPSPAQRPSLLLRSTPSLLLPLDILSPLFRLQLRQSLLWALF